MIARSYAVIPCDLSDLIYKYLLSFSDVLFLSLHPNINKENLKKRLTYQKSNLEGIDLEEEIELNNKFENLNIGFNSKKRCADIFDHEIALPYIVCFSQRKSAEYFLKGGIFTPDYYKVELKYPSVLQDKKIYRDALFKDIKEAFKTKEIPNLKNHNTYFNEYERLQNPDILSRRIRDTYDRIVYNYGSK